DIKYPSVKTVKDYIDASSSTGSADLNAEVTRATSAENVLTTNLATEATNRIAGDATLTVSLTTETTRALNAEGVLTTDLATEVARATASEATKEDVANKSTDITADATSDIKYPSVKTVKNYVDASSSTGSADLNAEVTRATNAENVLTTNLATEATNRIAADAAIAVSLTTESTRALNAEGVLTTDLATEVSRATASEATK